MSQQNLVIKLTSHPVVDHYSRDDQLDKVHEELLAAHDDDELDGELVEAAGDVALVAPELGHGAAPRSVLVFLPGVVEKLALK